MERDPAALHRYFTTRLVRSVEGVLSGDGLHCNISFRSTDRYYPAVHFFAIIPNAIMKIIMETVMIMSSLYHFYYRTEQDDV